MPYILLYTIHCPACDVLEKKLQKAGLIYSVIDDESEMQHIEQFPMMSVDCGPLMTFREADQWIKEITKNGKH